jgi:hypothetical protein
MHVATQAASSNTRRHMADLNTDPLNSDGLQRHTPNRALRRFGTVRPRFQIPRPPDHHAIEFTLSLS